jgi:predicted kinase
MKLFIVRGLPGSGKTTYANKLVSNGSAAYHHETDQFFVNADGHYNFNPSKLKEAHEWCQSNVRYDLRYGVGNVVVSNTFTQRWEVEPYLKIAHEVGVEVSIIKLTSDFGSEHDVPESTIEKMKNRWEDIPGEAELP